MRAPPAEGLRLPAPVELCGAPVHPVTLDRTLGFIEASIRMRRQAMVLNVNAHAVEVANRDPRFREILWSAPLVFCDGKGVQWAARLLGTPLPERFTPPDWIHRLTSTCAREGWGMFLLGGAPGVADEAADFLRVRHPGLSVHAHHGYFEKAGPQNDEVVRLINTSGARVLLVGFGMPLQEYWISENLPVLGPRVALSVGALLDYLAGRVYRAPDWMTRSGFEWLARLLVEPRRLWRRYLIGNTRFIARVASRRIRRDP